MQIAAGSVDEYLARVPDAHRPALTRVRDLVNENLPPGFEEGIFYGMITWYVPPERYGRTYNGQPLMLTALASQKNYMALYLSGVYGNPDVHDWFTSAFAAAGKKLDMGKSCLRFRHLDDLPLPVIAQVAGRISVDDFISTYERAQGTRKQKPVVMPAHRLAPTAAAAGKPKAAAAKSVKPVATSKPAAKAKAVAKSKPAAKSKLASKRVAKSAAKSKGAATSKPASKTKSAAKKKPARKR